MRQSPVAPPAPVAPVARVGNHKARYGAAAAIAAAIAAGLFLSSALWEGVELKAYDLRVRLVNRSAAQRYNPTGRVVVVGMEEKTMIKEKPLIFWYPEIGRFLKQMNECGATAVGIDLIPVHSLGEKMTEAARSMFRQPEHLKFFEEMGLQLDQSLLGPMLEASEVKIIQGVAEGLVPYYHGYIGFMKNVRPASVRLTVDKDETVRRQQLMEGDGMTFPYALYDSLGGQSKDHKEHGTVLINYALKDRIPFYSFAEVMDEGFDRGKLAGKGVLLGYITGYDDFHSTPLGRISGALIHATAVETLLSDSAFRDVKPFFKALILLLLVSASLLISVRLSPVAAISSVAVLMAAYFALNVHLFSRGSVAPLFPHILAPLLTYAFIYPYRYIVEERTRKRIYKTFSYYMDRKVIDSLISREPESILRGEQKTLCILFLDIRDFTTMSHMKRPEVIIKFLNRFFTVVTDTIQRHDGFVNKFIGDAVLAFFGTEKAATNAVAAAVELLKNIEALSGEQSVREFTGETEIRVGIGIHSGEVVIGNIGSLRKMDFTIIGDSVNIASRVEKLTKQLGRPVLISEAAVGMAGAGLKFEFLGNFQMRGLEKPIGIYTV